MNATTEFLQAERILRIDGLLGADALLAERLVFREAISELFEGELQLRSKSDDLAPDQIVGKTCDISLELGDGARRIWNVLVTNMTVGPKITRGLQSYRLVLRPSLWLLSQRSDCRIWQDMTSIEVCETLMREHGLASPGTRGIVAPPEAQHYSVQFNESDLAYLTRRLEADGIFYFFTHEAGRHVLTLASHAAGYTGGEDVRFAHGSSDLNHIHRFETSFAYTPGQRTARDWNFQTPGTVPEGGTPSLVRLPKNDAYELFEYPMVGGYGTGRASDAIDNARLERQAKLRMQASEADHRRVEGASNTRTLAAGHRFTPYDVANPDTRFDPHVILAIEHMAQDASYETGGGQPEYSNRFLALPADVPATPHRTTPRPRIDGTQVAIVAGPEGEEIHPDEYGRIKLWFPWDRRAKKDGTDTCWVRVTQSWAGAGWGGQVIPRIGMEVMVSYLDGDPDRPVVTGVVPNPTQKVPYPLPAHKTKSVFRTNSHKAEYRGFNELSLEDKAGEEEIYLHASKDMNIHTSHHRSELTDRNLAAKTGGSKSEIIDRGSYLDVKGSYHIEVGSMANHTSLSLLDPSWETFKEMGYLMDDAVRGDVVNDGDFRLDAQGRIALSTSSTMSADSVSDMTVHSGGHAAISAFKRLTIQAGRMLSVIAKARLILRSDRGIRVSNRNSSIDMDEAGNIIIRANSVKIESKGLIDLDATRIDLN
ncbi:MAG: type VI secretion system tip protein TssI/VgrG [Pseudomonadota bacterium]